MDSPKFLSFTYKRRFGVEMELNSFDLRDFKIKPLNQSKGEMPLGINEIAVLVNSVTGNTPRVEGWHLTHNNDSWVLKPDSSCGLELCSPVSQGWSGLKRICEVVDAVSKDDRISADNRCSLHVHVDVADCKDEEIAKILAYWIKFESVFLDSVPFHRKRNAYCQCIGLSDLFEHDSFWDPAYIIEKLGYRKYYTANCYHYHKKNRSSLEFRIAESEACLNPYLVKNWVRLIVHFVEVAKKLPIPPAYHPNDPMTGFCWLDPEDVMRLLEFDGDVDLSPGMEQTRNWFLSRLHHNVSGENVTTGVIWSGLARKIAREQINSLIDKLQLSTDALALKVTNPDLIYSNEFQE